MSDPRPCPYGVLTCMDFAALPCLAQEKSQEMVQEMVPGRRQSAARGQVVVGRAASAFLVEGIRCDVDTAGADAEHSRTQA